MTLGAARILHRGLVGSQTMKSAKPVEPRYSHTAMSEETIHRILEENQRLSKLCAERLSGKIAQVAQVFSRTLRAGNKILFFGNGGSAADAQHLAGELVNRFLYDRQALAGISLSTDTSVLTCIANDSDYEQVFSRQIEALGKPGDLAVGLSTSGNSANVLRAFAVARELGLTTVGLAGGTGGKLARVVDYPLIVPCHITPRIQEAHITIGHIICQLVEEQLCPRPRSPEA